MKGYDRAAWDNGGRKWLERKIVDTAVPLAVTAGTALCIASVTCSAGLFAVGASALFVAGLGTHMTLASEEEQRQGPTQFLVRTAEAEVKRIVSGAVFAREHQ